MCGQMDLETVDVIWYTLCKIHGLKNCVGYYFTTYFEYDKV